MLTQARPKVKECPRCLGTMYLETQESDNNHPDFSSPSTSQIFECIDCDTSECPVTGELYY